MPGLDVLTAVTFMWNLFALIYSLLDVSIVALPENTFCGGLHLGLDGAFSGPIQPVLLMREEPLLGWHEAVDPASGHTMDLSPWIPL